MLDRIRVALIWNKVVALASKGQYERSLAVLSRLPEKHRSGGVAFEVFHLLLNANLQKYRLVVEGAPGVLARIEREKSDDDRKRYMLAFVMTLERMAEKKLFEGRDVLASEPHAIDWNEIELESVPRMTRRMFPLRVHPKWREPR